MFKLNTIIENSKPPSSSSVQLAFRTSCTLSSDHFLTLFFTQYPFSYFTTLLAYNAICKIVCVCVRIAKTEIRKLDWTILFLNHQRNIKTNRASNRPPSTCDRRLSKSSLPYYKQNNQRQYTLATRAEVWTLQQLNNKKKKLLSLCVSVKHKKNYNDYDY